ncbi:UNVERIFIED_CONTAM: cytochrome [Sesamum radiatum]|uniref:Cytochrome n=1 Tax=Sesamum radiatum TaxID=300843 RepID=A0AAW2QED4_SESRA
MHLKLGSLDTIVVSSPELAQQVLQKHDQVLSSRPHPEVMTAYGHNKVSVGWLPAAGRWQVLRKICKDQMFSLQRLDSSDGLRQEKLRKLLDYVQECCDSCRVLDISDALFTTLLNLTSASLFSVEFAQAGSDSSHDFKGIVRTLTQLLHATNLADYFPLLKPIDPQGLKRKSVLYVGKLFRIFDDIIDQRLQSESRQYTNYEPKNDLLEALLDISRRNESELNRNDILHLLLAEADTEINGYIVPRNGQILVNAWAIGRDSNIWSNPDSFEPERFLDSKIDLRGQNFELIPFGSGRRICPGMPLAYRVVHVMVASLIHNFDWKLEGGILREEMDMKEKFRFSLQKAVPQKVAPLKL